MTIGILGGTGPQGRGLTRRVAAASCYKAHAGIMITDLP